jgi:type IV pilus assembly protein PilB
VKQFGEILLEGGHVTREQLAGAVEEQRRVGRSLGRVLVDTGVLTEGQLVAALATQIGLKFVDLSDCAVDGRRSPESPQRSAAVTTRCPSATRTASWSWRWPTRRTSSRSTTSGR